MTPNFDIEKFQLIITVHENATTFQAKSFNGKPISFQEMIGALESVKLTYVFDQSGINAEEYRKWKANKEKRANKKSK